MASLQPNSETDASGLLSAALARVLEIMVLAPWAGIVLLFADALEPYRYEWRISFNAQMFAYAASVRGIITLDHLRTSSSFYLHSRHRHSAAEQIGCWMAQQSHQLIH